MSEPDLTQAVTESIRRWSGIEPPNDAARHGLVDLVWLIDQMEKLRGTMVFEDEPSSFEAALQACKEQPK